MEKAGLETVCGIVEKITYKNEANGFTVALIQSDGRRISAIGEMADIEPGESVAFTGKYTEHAKYGRQLRVENHVKTEPQTAVAIERYLAGGAVKGIGPATARKLVRRFGAETLHIIENEPGRLCEIKSITAEKAAAFHNEFTKKKSVSGVLLYLAAFGIDSATGFKVYSALGENAAEKLKANPYLLCSGDIGMPFEKVDLIAEKIGGGVPQTERAKSGIEYILRHNLANGHTCLPAEKLYQTAEKLLNTGHDTVDDAVRLLISEKAVVKTVSAGGESYALSEYYECERMIAERLALFLRTPPEPADSIDAEIKIIEAEQNITYAPRQKEAIKLAAANGIFILTGGPGTGKTTTVNAIIRILENRGLSVQLAAPTGRAAKRMQDLCGKSAQTIHRLLEVSLTGDDGEPYYGKNEVRPLDCDVLIIDEMSMVDVKLFAALLKAIPLYGKLIMTGDKDQLPGVSAGNVLADLLACDKFPAVQLTEIFRQAQQSLIVTNARRIIEGEMPVCKEKNGDFFFIPADPDDVVPLVTDLYCRRLPQTYNYLPQNDIQILCPSRITGYGTAELNGSVQAAVNGDVSRPSIKANGCILRLGDKVMMMKNDYNIAWENDDGERGNGVYNGELGILCGIDLPNGRVTVRFPDKIALYEDDEITRLEPAYAITVHKSQGCEFPAVIIPLCKTPAKLRYRNLLYTAVTRAKECAIIVGSEEIMAEMIKNDRKNARYTALRYLI